MIVLSRRNLGPYRLTAFRQAETSRGICWSGHLTCDGTRIGEIEDRGDGGSTIVRISDPEARRALDVFLALHKPQIDVPADMEPVPEATEMWTWEENFALWLSEEADLLKSIKRRLKRAVVFALVSDPPGTFRQLREAYTAARARQLRSQFGGNLAWIANEELAENRA